MSEVFEPTDQQMSFAQVVRTFWGADARREARLARAQTKKDLMPEDQQYVKDYWAYGSQDQVTQDRLFGEDEDEEG